MGAMGWYIGGVGLLIGESVVKVLAGGGGRRVLLSSARTEMLAGGGELE